MKIITRQQAIARGLTKYFTGKPCKRGHLSERYTLTSNCAQCTIESTSRGRAKIRESQDEARG